MPTHRRTLTYWLAVTGQPGDTFQLRRQAPGSPPADYWVPQGVQIHKPLTLDLNGCWLRNRHGCSGSTTPNLAQSKLDYPRLYDDVGTSTDWPKHRNVVLVAASDVTIMSSLIHARIQGTARTVFYRGAHTLTGREHPIGCDFHGPSPGDGQHGIKIGGNAGAWSDANHYRNVTIDLTNISVEFVHGDGIELGDNHEDILIRGVRVGPEMLSGVPGRFDSEDLKVNSLAGGTIQQNAGMQYKADDPRSADRWVPWTTTPPATQLSGIHHVGRQGISASWRHRRVTLDGFSLWMGRRALVDIEPIHPAGYIDGFTMRNLGVGQPPAQGFRLRRSRRSGGQRAHREHRQLRHPEHRHLPGGRRGGRSLSQLDDPRCALHRPATHERRGVAHAPHRRAAHRGQPGAYRGHSGRGPVHVGLRLPTSANRTSTGVVFDPAESIQFPFPP